MQLTKPGEKEQKMGGKNGIFQVRDEGEEETATALIQKATSVRVRDALVNN